MAKKLPHEITLIRCFETKRRSGLSSIIKQLSFLLLCSFNLISTISAVSTDEIKTLKASGNYQQAFMKMLELQKKQPTDQLLFDMAQLLETMQDYTMAMLYYQELINTYPGVNLKLLLNSVLVITSTGIEIKIPILTEKK